MDVDVEEVLVFVLVEKLFPQGRESEIGVGEEKESDFGFWVGGCCFLVIGICLLLVVEIIYYFNE